MASSKKKGPVEKIALQCTECKRKNYTTEKNRRNTPNKLELMKYCPRGASRSVAPTARALVSKTGCCRFESYLACWHSECEGEK